MSRTQDIRRGHLVAAALMAGAAGLALYAVGWWIVGWEPRYDWDRLTDPNWWTGGLVRAAAFLGFSKFGFKAALLLVLGSVAAISWLRTRRRTRKESDAASVSEPEGSH